MLDPFEHPERGRVPKLVDPGASSDQESGDVPAAVANGVVKRGADGSPGCFEIGAVVDEHDGHVCVIGAGRPVQRGLGAIAAGVVIGVCARLEEHRYRGGCGGEVARPVGGRVQWGAPAALEAFAADHVSRSELRPVNEDAPECVQVATVDRRAQFDRDGIPMGQGQPGP